ncbi:hypothetical protein NLG97_g8387 [Lecanicillium saksenae]|uniref:Uncharacterized protein n=1 Tax=Lecanicillium saksenae TaxID=468837 RepID=A0ACC1QLQ6_9HYPO|nr:hypothetical protein NLG97_g8387 [Lecanicillium saksenae]
MYAPVAAVFALLATGALAQDPDDTFNDKCKYLNMLGQGKKGQTAITAWCLDDAGKRWQTTLNLNQCLGNNAGKLVWQDNGNFDQTCGPCLIDKLADGPPRNTALKCNCLPSPNGVPKYTYISMSPNVELDGNALAVNVVDGRFVCGPHQGTKEPRA